MARRCCITINKENSRTFGIARHPVCRVLFVILCNLIYYFILLSFVIHKSYSQARKNVPSGIVQFMQEDPEATPDIKNQNHKRRGGGRSCK
jgi:hypothetical protein